jgi:signal transduction histidine kinase
VSPRPVPVLSSVRARTTIAASLVVAVALTIGAVLLVQTLETALSRSRDDTARSRARDLSTLAAEGSLPPQLAPAGDDGFIQVVDGSGTVLASTPNAADRPPTFTFVAPRGVPAARTVRDVRDDQDLEDYRVLAMRVEAPAGPVTVYVANSLELVSETVAVLRGLLLVSIPVLVSLLAFVTWVVVGRALRPVESIRSQVADISDAGLDRRVPVPSGHDEVAQLARTMNEMLDRLAAASTRQRAFAADASHELQSPLTRFRTQLEVAMVHPGDVEWPEVAADLLADSAEMERLVLDLLFLAQEDAQPAAGHVDGLVDLDDVVLEEAARVRVGGAREVDTSQVSAAPVRGSREQLRRLVRNLLENAVRYATSRVQVSLTSGAGGVELVVRDDGPGVPRDERQRIFDRFVRLDDARSRDTGGTGLGLAIVEAITGRHGGTVQLADGDGGAVFVVRLPSPLGRP